MKKDVLIASLVDGMLRGGHRSILAASSVISSHIIFQEESFLLVHVHCFFGGVRADLNAFFGSVWRA